VHVSKANGGQDKRTLWKGFHGCTSAEQTEPGSAATHRLEGISWAHVSEANGGQEERSNSLSGRDFVAVSSNGGQQRLTFWLFG